MINMRCLFTMLLCGFAAACGGQAESMVAPSDYRARHPIELRENEIVLDVWSSRSLDAHARAQVVEFALDYQRKGTGPIMVMLPSGTSRDADYRRQFDEIRRVLVQSGMRGSVKLGTYIAPYPHLASPVRLSFTGLRARVAGACGQWPDDLASGGSTEGWSNAPYQNFGCASQAMWAAQAADPRDLFGKQATAASDADARLRPIQNMRRGVDAASYGQAR